MEQDVQGDLSDLWGGGGGGWLAFSSNLYMTYEMNCVCSNIAVSEYPTISEN